MPIFCSYLSITRYSDIFFMFTLFVLGLSILFISTVVVLMSRSSILSVSALLVSIFELFVPLFTYAMYIHKAFFLCSFASIMLISRLSIPSISAVPYIYLCLCFDPLLFYLYLLCLCMHCPLWLHLLCFTFTLMYIWSICFIFICYTYTWFTYFVYFYYTYSCTWVISPAFSYFCLLTLLVYLLIFQL